jgi:DNA-binding Lrp family transcriptional regulator
MEILKAHARGGEVEISYRELMSETGWSRVTISRGLREAQEAGVLEREHRPNRPNFYRLRGVYTGLLPASLGPSRSFPHVAANQEAENTRTGYPGQGMLQPTEETGDGTLLGREEVLTEVERLTAKGANTLILGFEGYGKSHLLRHLSLDGFAHPCDVLIHFSTPGPAKDFLLNLVEELHRQGDLAEGVEVEEFEKALGKLKVRELFRLVRDALARSRKRYLLLIDDIDQITPMQKPMLQELLELRNVQVIATAKTERPRYASLWHHFFPVELRPLSREASDRLVEEFISGRGIPVADEKKNLEVLKERLYRLSRGNPRDLFALLRRIEVQGYVDREYLQKELGVGLEEPIIDMTWFIVATAAIIMAARYLGLGLHDRGLYILAGISYAAMILVRWLSYRWRK